MCVVREAVGGGVVSEDGGMRGWLGNLTSLYCQLRIEIETVSSMYFQLVQHEMFYRDKNRQFLSRRKNIIASALYIQSCSSRSLPFRIYSSVYLCMCVYKRKPIACFAPVASIPVTVQYNKENINSKQFPLLLLYIRCNKPS